MKSIGGKQKFWGYIVFFPLFLLASALPLGCMPGTHEERGISVYEGDSLGPERCSTVRLEECVL